MLLDASELTEFKRLLESSFEIGKYLLSEETEKALMLTNNVSYGNWVSMTSEFLSAEEASVLNKDGIKETKNFSELFTLIAEPKKEVRDGAAKAIDAILAKHSKVAEIELNSVLEYKKVKEYGIKLGKFIEWGVSPRASINFFIASKANAFLNGRRFVIPQDIKETAKESPKDET